MWPIGVFEMANLKRALMLTAIVWPGVVNADLSSVHKEEINHLLNFVKNSLCDLNRNGKVHKGREAVSHIEKKQRYFRDEISTTEKFIELSATRSTISGKYYTVSCNGEVMKTQQWLLNELQRFRESSRTSQGISRRP